METLHNHDKLRSLTVKPRPSLGLSLTVSADQIALNNRTLAVRRVNVPVVRQRSNVKQAKEIIDRLNAIAGPAEAVRWLDTHQAVMGGYSPMELLQRGRFEPVMRAIVRVEQGIPA